jgi:cytoskeleton protein RodZ
VAEAAPLASATNQASDAAAKPAAAEPPLVASLAPFPSLAHKDAAPAAAVPANAPAPAASTGAHSLRLSLKEASWVEVVATNGDKLEYGLLPAGTTRTYHSDAALDVRLGNSNGATIEVDGQSQDLAPFRRANVAHFKAFSAGQPISN